MLPSSTRCSARLNSRNWLITQSMLMHSSGPRLPLRNDTCQCLSITVWRYQIVHMRGVCPIGNDQCHFVGCNKFKIAKKKMLVGYRVATGHPKPNSEKKSYGAKVTKTELDGSRFSIPLSFPCKYKFVCKFKIFLLTENQKKVKNCCAVNLERLPFIHRNRPTITEFNTIRAQNI